MKQYLKLLMIREGKEVLGKNGSNLWVLTIVLVATFASIAFSEGSMIYLQDKMEDPFTNWVSIAETPDDVKFKKFMSDLNDPNNMVRFGYSNVQFDHVTNWNIQGCDSTRVYYLRARCFPQLHSNLVNAILDESNVIGGAVINSEVLEDKSLGLIVSQSALKNLGYDENSIPSYVYHPVQQADTLGLKLSSDGFYPVPLPVIAVVRRLPNNVDIMASEFFYNQREKSTLFPFDFSENEDYLHQLYFFVSDDFGKEKFDRIVEASVPSELKQKINVIEDHDCGKMLPWKPGKIYSVYVGEPTMDRQIFARIAESIEQKAANDNDVKRIHNYKVQEVQNTIGENISIEFSDLGHIRDFERFAKEYDVQLEMSQVASKENFNSVTVMAAILSAAMVIFSIVCIVMFMVNMLQGYFQKVKRNLGTFKAFGMNTRELTYVYIIILILIVFSAVVSALLITWCIQVVLPLVGVERDGFNFLSLWNNTTYVATIVVLLSTVVTVIAVMANMLSRTPGDLIYDRN